MKGVVQDLLRRWWAGELGVAGRLLDVATAPLAWAYAAEVGRRNRWADQVGGARIPGLRVLSVGNLAVGGTGKTPVAAWTARTLVSAGADVALVARGYGRDELLLHHRWNPVVPVLADVNRVAAARRARAQGAEVVVLDDGFQHRRLGRDLDVVLLAAEDPFPARLLPRGPYREPAGSLARAHVALVTRRTVTAAEAAALADRVEASHPHLATAVVALLPGGWQDLSGAPAPAPSGDILAVAAVARPHTFGVQLEAETGQEVEVVPFADHHEFTADDARALRARARERTVVVTEKDAVKLQAHEALLEPIRVLAQRLAWERGEERVTRLVQALHTERKNT